MKLGSILLAALLQGIFCLSGFSAVLQNGRFRAVICEDWEGTHAPGSLIEFSDLGNAGGNVLAGMAYSGEVTAGDFHLSPGFWETLNDSEGVLVSPTMSYGASTLPVRVTLHYALTQTGLDISWRVDCDQAVTFSEGLGWDWDVAPWDTLVGFNQVGQTDTIAIAAAASRIYPLRAIWRLNDSEKCLWLIQPDPLQARWNLNSGCLRQEWLHSRYGNSTFPVSQFPKIASTLSPTHSIWGNLSLQISPPNIHLPNDGAGCLFLSGMPEGGEQGFIFMWDELPLIPETFQPMTTSINPATPTGSKIVALLEAHPTLKNVLLLGMDKQLSGYPFRPYLPQWNVPESFVCIDTVDQVEGSGALTVSHYTSRTTWVMQTINCNPGEMLRLSGWVRVDSISSGWAGITFMGDSIGIQPQNFVFTAPQAWTFCEAEINAGPNDSLTVEVGMIGGPGKVRFDNLHLERPGYAANLLLNAGFNSFSFAVTYDGEGLQWWHAHGQRRLATKAPVAYLEFLRRVEDGTPLYGWEDRAQLGMHCYHHTATELYPLGSPYAHEFNFYDPVGDSGRFDMIHRDLLDAGLSQASLTALRFPGHKHLLPAVIECAKRGVKFIDRGRDDHGNCFLGVIILPEGVVWETNSNWWSDYNDWVDVDTMHSVLDRGELVLGGGHPWSTFPSNDPGRFDVVSAVFSNLEDQYPDLNYLFPADFATFCEESRTWEGVSSKCSPSSYEFTFCGSASAGQTIVALLQDTENIFLPPLVDYQPVPAEIRGHRVFIELPNLPPGTHSVVLLRGVGVPPPPSLPQTCYLGLPFPNPSNGWLTFPVELPEESFIDYCLTDVLGRVALRGRAVASGRAQHISVNITTMPSGIYFLAIQSGDLSQQGKFTILK